MQYFLGLQSTSVLDSAIYLIKMSGIHMQIFFMIPLKIASVSKHLLLDENYADSPARLKTNPSKSFSTEKNTKYINHHYFIQDWPHLTQEPHVVSRVRIGRKKELFTIQF